MSQEKLNKLVMYLRDGKPVTEDWVKEKLDFSDTELSECIAQGYLIHDDGNSGRRYWLTEKGKKLW